MTTSSAPSDHDTDDFRPSATLETLQIRAQLLQATRKFFEQSGYWEVQTPLLSRDANIDAHIESFAVSTADQREFFLQTSPEFAMKRLLAAGADSIYQISPAFRRGETGRLHNPEFTIVEWYRRGVTYHDQMDCTERFVRDFFAAAAEFRGTSPAVPGGESAGQFDRLRYDDAFARFLGRTVLDLPTAKIVMLTRDSGVVAPEDLADDDRDGWLNLLLAERLEPNLGTDRPLFLYDYPASQSALAAVAGDPPVAQRFELYIGGIELCNGYQELTDAEELRRRIRAQSALRKRENRPPLPEDPRLLAAMESGLPECSGVALGFDRLLMLALSLESVRDVMSFDGENA